MKGLFYRFAVTLMIITLTLPILTQAFGGSTDVEVRTQLEAFLTQKGILLIKEFYDLGTVSGMYGSGAHFVAVVIYEPGRENQKVKGLKIEITSGGRFEKKESSFLDQEGEDRHRGVQLQRRVESIRDGALGDRQRRRRRLHAPRPRLDDGDTGETADLGDGGAHRFG